MNSENVKKFGFWSIVLLTINSIIGAGIFLSPGEVVKMSGQYAPYIYLIAAVFATVLAVTFASAAKYVSKGGAAYAYTKAAFGDGTGLYVGVTRYFSAAIAWGVMATGVVKSVLRIFNLDSASFSNITVGFVVLMIVLVIINLLGTRFIEFVSNISTVGKLLVLVTVIIAGVLIVVFTGANNYSHINDVTKDVVSKMDFSAYVVAIIAAFYAFTGFESVASGSDDMENPEKNLPIAIPLGMGIIAFIYIGIVLVTMMINPVELVKSKEVVALLSVFDNPIIKNIILYGSLVSMFGINVAASFHTPRVLESMAKQGQVPVIFTKRTKSGFPIYATVITAVIAILLPIAFDYNMGSIMIISSIARFAQFVLVPIAIIMFFYGKQKQEIITTAKKNFVTDVVVPLISLVLTIILLVKFDWTGKFTLTSEAGLKSPNYLAIASMVIGFVVLPIITAIYNKSKK